MPVPIAELSEPDEFARRHIGPSDDDMSVMLDRLGVSTAADLLAQTMPASIVDTNALGLAEAVPEHEALARTGFEPVLEDDREDRKAGEERHHRVGTDDD